MKVISVRKVQIGKIQAFVDLETSEGIIIKGFKIAQGPDGLFVGFPSQRGTGGKYFDTVTTNDPTVRNAISEIVMDAFESGVSN